MPNHSVGEEPFSDTQSNPLLAQLQLFPQLLSLSQRAEVGAAAPVGSDLRSDQVPSVPLALSPPSQPSSGYSLTALSLAFITCWMLCKYDPGGRK